MCFSSDEDDDEEEKLDAKGDGILSKINLFQLIRNWLWRRKVNPDKMWASIFEKAKRWKLD